MSTARKAMSIMGANPFVLDGPLVSSTTTPTGGAGSGLIMPAARLGDTCVGDSGSEYVYCLLALSGATLVPGQAYVIDKQFTATLATTSNSPRGNNVGFCQVNAPTAPATGTYYVWLQRKGNTGVWASASPVANTPAETSATGGKLGFPTSGTTGAKAIVGCYNYATSFTCTATTTSGSPTLTNVVMTAGSDFSDIVVGATISGTGVPASSYVGSVSSVGGALTIGLTTSDLKTAANATATANTITMTVAGTLVSAINLPYVGNTF